MCFALRSLYSLSICFWYFFCSCGLLSFIEGVTKSSSTENACHPIKLCIITDAKVALKPPKTVSSHQLARRRRELSIQIAQDSRNTEESAAEGASDTDSAPAIVFMSNSSIKECNADSVGWWTCYVSGLQGGVARREGSGKARTHIGLQDNSLDGFEALELLGLVGRSELRHHPLLRLHPFPDTFTTAADDTHLRGQRFMACACLVRFR